MGEYFYLPNNNKMSASTNNTTNIKKITFAMLADASEMPVKPNIPAMIEMPKNNKTRRNMLFPQFKHINLV
jgi:hypothetical protein